MYCGGRLPPDGGLLPPDFELDGADADWDGGLPPPPPPLGWPLLVVTRRVGGLFFGG